MQPTLQHLPFPFSKKVTIQLTTGKKTLIVECELASSVIEIFQSLATFEFCLWLALTEEFLMFEE